MSIKKAVLCAAALGVTALLIHYFPALPVSRRPSDARERQLITVWLAGDLPGAAKWLKKQASAYEKQRGDTGVWLRTVTEGEMRGMAGTPPDLAVWTAGVRLPDDLPLGEARPLCLSGYVLARPRKDEAATPAPRSLFGVTPTPDPRVTPLPQTQPWPERFWADDGFGALALRSMSAPAGAEFAPRAQVLAQAQAGDAALLSVSQLAAMPGEYAVIAAAPATDLVLYAALSDGASEAARLFLERLLSPDAQTALAGDHLLPARGGLRLYGPEQPALFALQFALAEGWLAPPDWGAQQTAQAWTAQALYAAANFSHSASDD